MQQALASFLKRAFGHGWYHTRGRGSNLGSRSLIQLRKVRESSEGSAAGSCRHPAPISQGTTGPSVGKPEPGTGSPAALTPDPGAHPLGCSRRPRVRRRPRAEAQGAPTPLPGASLGRASWEGSRNRQPVSRSSLTGRTFSRRLS